MSLKLCIVTPSHWKAVMGGSQYQAKVLIEYLSRHYDVEITYLTTRTDPSYRPEGYEIVKFSSPSGLRRFAFFFDAVKLYRALARARPDVIFQIVGTAHTGIAAFYARQAGCRMVWRVSSDRSIVRETLRWWRLHKRIERSFLDYGIRNAHLILAQSQYQRRQLEMRYGRNDVCVVPNFHPLPAKCTQSPTLPYQVVWVATLKPLKNPAAFVQLARHFADRRDVRFVIMGRPAVDDTWAARLMRSIAAQQNLTYLGERSQNEVNAMLEKAYLLVNTSDVEGFSNTFVQAWMRGVPVVSLHVDPDGLLSTGQLGRVSGNEQQLWRDVGELLDSPESRREMGRRCRAYAEANHTMSNIDQIAGLLRLREVRAELAQPA